MMYWPRPTELKFQLSLAAMTAGREIIEAEILAVDRCWRGSIPAEYVPHTKTYHLREIDQTAREKLLAEADRLEIPDVRMLGNNHLSFQAGSHLFSLLREMADLGYLHTMPFALLPCDADRFRYYFRSKDVTTFCEQPTLTFHGEAA